MAYWSTAAELLRRPKLAHDVNDKIADLTETRIDDYEEIIATIARSLSLPAPSPRPERNGDADPAQSLVDAGSDLEQGPIRVASRTGNGTPRQVDARECAKLFVTTWRVDV